MVRTRALSLIEELCNSMDIFAHEEERESLRPGMEALYCNTYITRLLHYVIVLETHSNFEKECVGSDTESEIDNDTLYSKLTTGEECQTDDSMQDECNFYSNDDGLQQFEGSYKMLHSSLLSKSYM